MNTPLSRELAARRVASDMSDAQFYEVHPDLRPFDNGAGALTNAENTDVELQELRAHGEALLRTRGEAADNEDRFLRVAAQDLLRVLQTKHPAEARYVVNSVLDRDARSVLMKHGGLTLYPETRNMHVRAQRYPSRHRAETPCDVHNSLSITHDTLRVERVTEHVDNSRIAAADRCTVDMIVLRVDREAAHAQVTQSTRFYCSLDAQQELVDCHSVASKHPRSTVLEELGLLSPFYGAAQSLSDTAEGHETRFQLFLFREMLKAMNPHRIL